MDSLTKDEFDLTVDAAQVVLGPGFEVGPEGRIDAQKKRFCVQPFCDLSGIAFWCSQRDGLLLVALSGTLLS